MNTPLRRIYAQVSEICPRFIGMDLTPKDIERFDTYIRRGPVCWEWTGELNNKGYGRFTVYRGKDRERFLAHRLAYRLATGEDIEGLVLRHTCDNPPCVRISHLIPGTQLDNMRDCLAKGRMNLSGLEIGQRMSTRAARQRGRAA